jgi:uncharacterized cupin superfamily protein
MRPAFLKNRREIESLAELGSDETFGYAAFLSNATGMSRLKVLHLRLPPGRRSHLPGAYRDEEEFFFVLEGAPDLWVDGHLYGLREGVGVAVNDRTGMSHSVINNSDREVRLFVMGEGTRMGSKFFHPLDSNEHLKALGKHWADPPRRKLGPNDARPGSTAGRRRGSPEHVVYWRDILNKKPARYPDSDEDQGLSAPFGKRARFSRIGIHAEVLKPGRRTSYPHAERDEDEFVYVVQGAVDAWTDGHITPMGEGDFIGWEGGSGITHVILNNSDEDALLLVGGEASKVRNQYWYPYHPSRNKAAGANYWADHPIPKLGPHDGLPDALREKLPKRARRSALAANKAALRTGR